METDKEYMSTRGFAGPVENMQKMISNIVFTKNRPLQLDAYLESLYRYFPPKIIQTYVIYKEEFFGEQYDTLFRKFPDCIAIREKDFHSDFLKVLSQISTKYILFGVDDVVFFDSVDFNVIDQTFAMYAEEVLGFSLRYSKEVIIDMGGSIYESVVAGQTVYSINWAKDRSSQTRRPFRPFELCATVYPTALVKKIIDSAMNNNPLVKKLFSPSSFLIRALRKAKPRRSVLKFFGYFYSPNKLESWNYQWCMRNKERLPNYLYFQKLCASAIQVNMVNTSTGKIFDGNSAHTVETLNEMYKQGYRFDINKLKENKPAKTHSDKSYFLLTREQKNQCRIPTTKK